MLMTKYIAQLLRLRSSLESIRRLVFPFFLEMRAGISWRENTIAYTISALPCASAVSQRVLLRNLKSIIMSLISMKIKVFSHRRTSWGGAGDCSAQPRKLYNILRQNALDT